MKSEKATLLDDSDSEENVDHFTINEHFAKAYEVKKEREELSKLKEKYGSDAEEDGEEEDSEDAESEDEDGEELTPAVDAAILRTLARIKRKDPAIYEQGKDVFTEEIKKSGDLKLASRSSKTKQEKPLTMRQHALQSALNPTSRSPSPQPLTHVKEQEVLRNETIAAFHTAVDGEEEEEEDLLVLREKTKDEVEQEEEEYREFLQREVGADLSELIQVEKEENGVKVEDNEQGSEDGEGEKKKKKKEKKAKAKSKGGKDKEENDQEFLMNYILNRGWIDRSAKRLPTYKEITASQSKGKGKAKAVSDDDDDEGKSEGSAGEEGLAEDLEAEEEFDEVADLFETSYNFRFEEPGADQIARFPRNLASTARREDTTRKEARERRKERKEEEKLKKKEEVKRLKALKMKQIRAKLERVGKEGGKNVDETAALQELDLEGDWDPDAHDAQMFKIYGEDDIGEDMEKPSWDDDIDVADIVPLTEDSDFGDGDDAGPSEKKSKKKKKKKSKDKDVDEAEAEGVDVDEMDADVVMGDDDGEWDGTEEMRKKKLDEYMNELYELEFNDMVGGMPTRFRYTQVPSQSFALTPAEILMATDAELNQYMGLRKIAPYRKDGTTWDKNRGARLKEFKDTLKDRGVSGAGRDGDKITGEKPAKKRKGKKERMREKGAVAMEAVVENDAEDVEEVQEKTSSKKRKAVEDVSAAADRIEGTIEPTKTKRRRHKKSGKHAAAADD